MAARKNGIANFSSEDPLWGHISVLQIKEQRTGNY